MSEHSIASKKLRLITSISIETVGSEWGLSRIQDVDSETITMDHGNAWILNMQRNHVYYYVWTHKILFSINPILTLLLIIICQKFVYFDVKLSSFAFSLTFHSLGISLLTFVSTQLKGSGSNNHLEVPFLVSLVRVFRWPETQKIHFILSIFLIQFFQAVPYYLGFDAIRTECTTGGLTARWHYNVVCELSTSFGGIDLYDSKYFILGQIVLLLFQKPFLTHLYTTNQILLREYAVSRLLCSFLLLSTVAKHFLKSIESTVCV